MELFITTLFKQPALYVSTVAAFAGSICVHEYCHAFIAHKLGDDTAKEGGFLTLNPLKVMGWLSIVALLVFGFSWGAVPVKREDPSRLRRAAISLGGPLSNFFLLLLAAFMLKGVYAAAPYASDAGFGYYVRLVLICVLYANAILFLFNILPIPPLDGWGALESFLPKCLIPSEKTKSTIFRVFIYLICFSSASGFFDKAVDALADRFMPSQISANSLVEEGEKCFEAKNYGGAYKAFAEAAEQGNLAGRLNLAFCLAEGYGCDENPEKAFSLFAEPGVRDFPLARFYLGGYLLGGEVCEKDEHRAFMLLNDKEILEAFPGARYMLGICYYAGLGTKQDFAKAAANLKAAADAGVAEAAEFLGYQNGRMPDYGVPLEEVLRRYWNARQ